MSKAINAFVNATDEESTEQGRPKIVLKEFEPHYLPERKKQFNPHERVVTKVREVKYLRDGFVREDNITRKIVLESYGTEIVEEVLVPRDSATLAVAPKVVGQVIRDFRSRDVNGN